MENVVIKNENSVHLPTLFVSKPSFVFAESSHTGLE